MRFLRWWWAALLLTAAGLSGFAAAADRERTILVLGDSLSAGYGLPAGSAWPDLLARKMAQTIPAFKVVNASISGETTFGGASRVRALLAAHRPAVVIVELGANDGLRGTDLALTRANLRRIVGDITAAGARAVVVGMRIPPNYGPKYTQAFHALFGEVAREQGAGYVPFLLEGIAEHRELFLEDGLHPVAAAQPRILDNVWPALEPLLAPRLPASRRQ